MPHEKTEMEFAAKFVNDKLRERFPDQKLQFMTFVMDEGEGGHLGYIATVNRIDAARVVMEWLTHVLIGFDRKELVEMLAELTKEMPDD